MEAWGPGVPDLSCLWCPDVAQPSSPGLEPEPSWEAFSNGKGGFYYEAEGGWQGSPDGGFNTGNKHGLVSSGKLAIVASFPIPNLPPLLPPLELARF